MAAAPVSMKENVPSAAKAQLVNNVHSASGLAGSLEAQSRNGVAEGPVPVRDTFPFANLAIPPRCGVRTMRKIVPPPPGPPWLVVP